MHISHSVGPSSPPQTPTLPSPVAHHTGHAKAKAFSPEDFAGSMASGSFIHPVGNGPNFTYRRPVRPEQLSPQSSGSSSAASVSSSASEQSLPKSSDLGRHDHESTASRAPLRVEREITQASFVVEELSDFDGSGGDGVEVIRPHAIEYADSDRSRSRSRSRRELDPKMIYNLRNLNCSDDSDNSDIDLDDLDYQRFLARRREEKRRRRMTSGSIGKRTISESIGSDSDREDVLPFLEVNDVGSSARRLRRKVGDRRSLQFQDPPPPRIEELEEPPTSEDEMLDGETLARELPYYTLEYISMEIDSP